MSRSSTSSPSSPWPRFGQVPLTRCPECPRVEPLIRLTCKKLETGNFGREFVKCESRPQPGKLLRQCSFFMWMDSYVEKLQIDGKLQGHAMGEQMRAEEDNGRGLDNGNGRAELLFLEEVKSMNEQLSKMLELKREEIQVAKLFYGCIVMLALILVVRNPFM